MPVEGHNDPGLRGANTYDSWERLSADGDEPPVALPWYTRESYDSLVRMMDDRDLMPASFDRWLEQARQVIAKSEAEGTRVWPALIDPDEFAVWCGENGFNRDSCGRLAFAEAVLAAAAVIELADNT